jgi:hypothetical protein
MASAPSRMQQEARAMSLIRVCGGSRLRRWLPTPLAPIVLRDEVLSPYPTQRVAEFSSPGGQGSG